MKRTLTDKTLIAAEVGLNLIPVVGGALATLVDKFIPEQAAKAAEHTVELLGEKVAELGDRIDHDTINLGEFGELFRSSIQICARTSREEKLRAAANILANHLLRPGDAGKSSYEELDHLMVCVEALSVGALTVLGAVHHISKSTPMGNQGHIYFQQLLGAFKDWDNSLVMSLVGELRGLNLVRVQDQAVRQPDDAGVIIEITPIGRRFVERYIQGVM